MQPVPAKPARWLVLSVVVVSLLAVTLTAAFYLPPGMDWHWVIRPGCLALLRGESPFDQVPYFGFPPWALIPFLPIAVLPEAWGRALAFTIALLVFAYVVWKLGAGLPAMLAFLLSPPVIHSLYNSNLDWLPLLGFTMPPALGLFFISVKPQMGSVVALFWLVDAWRTGGLLNVVKVFTPFTAVFLLSLTVFGFYPSHFGEIQLYSQSWNASLFPASIPVGLALVVAALRRREIRFAMAASPCLSPYVLLHAWSGALAALSTQTLEMLVAVLGLWLVILLRFL